MQLTDLQPRPHLSAWVLVRVATRSVSPDTIIRVVPLQVNSIPDGWTPLGSSHWVKEAVDSNRYDALDAALASYSQVDRKGYGHV